MTKREYWKRHGKRLARERRRTDAIVQRFGEAMTLRGAPNPADWTDEDFARLGGKIAQVEERGHHE